MKIKLFNLQFFNEGEEGTVDTPVENPDSNADTSNVDSQATEGGEATPDYSDFLTAVNGKAVYKGEATDYNSFDDVITDAQKGKNYDPVHERMTSAEAKVLELENSAGSKYFNKFLKDAGFETFDDYKQALDVSELVKEGMSEERAIEHVKGQRALTTDNETKAQANKAATQETQKSAQMADAIDWYAENGYGELTADKIEQSTLDKARNEGIPLKYALMEQLLPSVKSDAQQETLKKLQNKQDKSIPPVDSANNKQGKGVWDMSNADFDKQRAKIKRGY